jgi:hypothetical protein
VWSPAEGAIQSILNQLEHTTWTTGWAISNFSAKSQPLNKKLPTWSMRFWPCAGTRR